MAAAQRWTGSLLLCLAAWGCGSPSIRWNAYQREPSDPASDELANGTAGASDDGNASGEPGNSLTDAIALGGHSTSGNHRLLPALDSISQPEPLVEMEVPTTERAVSLSGHIDVPPDAVEDASANQVDPPPYAASSDEPAVQSMAGSLPRATAPDAEASAEGSPWGLPRIPNVLDMSRLAEDATAASDWGWGLSEHLLPGSRSEATTTSEEPPVRSASLSRTIPAESAVWGTSSAYSQEELAKLISLIEAELTSATPTTESERRDFIRRHALLRNLYLLAGRPHDAQQAIPQIDPADQEFWTEMYWAMSSYFDEEMLPSRGDRASQAVDRLASAQRALEPLVPLEIRNLQFCRRIDGYGNYESFGVNEFTAGQQLLLYSEVVHFTSEVDPSGVHRTLLESEIEIYSEGASRELIDRTVFPSTEDLCRSRRDDYFHSYRIDLPATVPPGSYVLELTVEDRLSGKTATQSRRFVVVSGSGIR